MKSYQLLFGDTLDSIITNQDKIQYAIISLLCYWAITELEMCGADVVRRLNVSNSTVSRSVVCREKVATDMKLKLLHN